MSLSKLILKIFGWKVSSGIIIPPKCILVIAPHTSFTDFIWGKLGLIALGQRTKFLIKKEFFFFPLGLLIRSLGAIPVERGKYGSPIAVQMKKEFMSSETFKLVITVEGTRKKTRHWKKGFWQIALTSEVPVVYGWVDYRKKEMRVEEIFELTGNWEKDIALLKSKYNGVNAKYPDCFTNE